MAKIEITSSPDDLEKICTFLKSNNIRFGIVDDYGNHSVEDTKKYKELIEKFK